MKFSGNMCFKIILKATKNQGSTLSLEGTFFEKPQERGWGSIWPPLPPRHFRIKRGWIFYFFVNIFPNLILALYAILCRPNFFALTSNVIFYRCCALKEFEMLLRFWNQWRARRVYKVIVTFKVILTLWIILEPSRTLSQESNECTKFKPNHYLLIINLSKQRNKQEYILKTIYDKWKRVYMFGSAMWERVGSIRSSLRFYSWNTIS